MNALAILLFTAGSWLYTTNSDTAVKFGKALNEACGYPNPSTFTYRAVMVETNVSKTVTNYTVISPDAIYAPKLRTYLATVSVLPKERQTEAPVDDFSNVNSALGNAKTNAVPAPKEGTLAAQDFVLVTEAVLVKVKEEGSATNIVGGADLARKAAWVVRE